MGLYIGGVFSVFHDILDTAVQNRTQLIQGMGRHMLVFSQTIQLSGTDVVFLDQFILRYTLDFHGIPKPLINDHVPHHLVMCYYYITGWLKH